MLDQKSVDDLIDADSDRDFIVISDRISRELHYRLSRALEKQSSNSRCTVFLTTWGGDPDGGYRIARCLRHYYKDGIRLVIPSWCKSAGTLIAMGADELAIGDLGELGPVDIQVLKGSELEERSSGLDIQEAVAVIEKEAKDMFVAALHEIKGMGLSTKLSGEFAAQVTAALVAPIASQIDPIRLGEMNRATRIAHEYGARLSGRSGNLKPGAIAYLITKYPTHSFVIDRLEAKILFNRVSNMNSPETVFCDKNWGIIGEPNDTVLVLTRSQPNIAAVPTQAVSTTTSA